MSDTAPTAPLTLPDVTIERVLGRGGMGVVYLGRQTYLDRTVAVKVLSTAGRADAGEFTERFRREAKILASLLHPNIVACHQAGVTPDGSPFLVMEYITGPNLLEYIERHGPLADDAALEVIRAMAKALAHAHANGIIHRDVKPENILLQPIASAAAEHGFPFVPKLADLGLALPVSAEGEQARLTTVGMVMGSPATMAPEQFNDPDHVDFRADIYGLGCVLFHALTGKRAFPDKRVTEIMLAKARGDVPDPAAVVPGLRRDLSAFARLLLAAQRESRPQSHDDVIRWCESLGLAESTTGRLATTVPIGAKRAAPGRWLAIGGIALAAAVLAVLLAGRAFRERDHPLRDAARDIRAGRPFAKPPRRAEGLAPKGARLPPKFDAAPIPLFGKDFARRLDGWGPAVGPASFGPDEDSEDGVSARGKGGRLPRELGAGPWRVAGNIGNVASEAGIRVDLADGTGLALRFQRVGTWLLTVQEMSPATPDGPLLPAGKVLDSAGMPARGEDNVPFAAIVAGEVAHFRAGPRSFGPFALGSAPVGVSLYVNGESVRFRELTLQR